MSKPKFTPGPWVAENHNGDWWVFGEGGEVARVIPWSTDADQADAHLISAAPDMYAALKYLADNACTDRDGEHVRLSEAYAALAKAEGKT